MKNYIYTVKDNKASLIGTLFTCENDDVALRLFAHLKKTNQMIRDFPNDFILLRLGLVDTESGLLEPEASHEVLAGLDSTSKPPLVPPPSPEVG